MKIGNRLTFQFCVIVTTLLILFSLSIFYFSQDFREAKIIKRLTDRASTTARLLLEVKELDKDLLKLIDKNTSALPEEQVEVFNEKYVRIYHSSDNDTICPPKDIFESIKKKGLAYFKNHKKDAVGLIYGFNNSTYFVLASARDEIGTAKIKDLKILLVILLSISLIITIIAGKIFSKQILSPILKVIKQVNQINASSLKSRVDEGNKIDEIAILAMTFNRMLERLEIAFEMQRNFALNASHELRTPLTSVTGQIEITLMKKRSVEEYEQILMSVQEDIKNLNEVTNGLLDLVHSGLDIKNLILREIRIDELILHTQKEVMKRNPQNMVYFNFDELPENEEKLTIYGNENLLKTAFHNIIDNACKFSSDKTVVIKIEFADDFTKVKFIDKGIGIPGEDMDKIFVPFFRSTNISEKSGFGIGLPLVNNIITLHNGKIEVNSEVNKGTVFTIFLPFKQTIDN